MNNFWEHYPTDRLMAETSLWSADFTRFGEEIQRMDPYTDLYHIDVADDQRSTKLSGDFCRKPLCPLRS